jgi:EAL domain-containing protein (putative c-di-GMP-specific phosphodiesterase class I)
LQLQALTEVGCDQAQGFLWSPGVAPELASRWLGRRSSDPRAGATAGADLLAAPIT